MTDIPRFLIANPPGQIPQIGVVQPTVPRGATVGEGVPDGVPESMWRVVEFDTSPEPDGADPIRRLYDNLAQQRADEQERVRGLEAENAELRRQIDDVRRIAGHLDNLGGEHQVRVSDIIDDLRWATTTSTCRACPPECPSCTRENENCECYDRPDPNWETSCPSSADRKHCEHWYDAGPCCGCGDGPGDGLARPGSSPARVQGPTGAGATDPGANEDGEPVAASDGAPEEAYTAAAQAMLPAVQANEDMDLFEWHPCTDQPNCFALRGNPCACSGMPWPSEAVRAAVDAVWRMACERGDDAIAIAEQRTRSAAMLRQELDRTTREWESRGEHVVLLGAALDQTTQERDVARAELKRLKDQRIISVIFGHHKGAPRPFALQAGDRVLVALGAEFPDGAVALRLANGGGWTTKSGGGADGLAVDGLQIIWLSDELEPLADMEQQRDAARAERDQALARLRVAQDRPWHEEARTNG